MLGHAGTRRCSCSLPSLTPYVSDSDGSEDEEFGIKKAGVSVLLV